MSPTIPGPRSEEGIGSNAGNIRNEHSATLLEMPTGAVIWRSPRALHGG